MPDGNVAEQHDDFDIDSLFGSPPPSPGRGRSSSPLALPGGQNSVQNVGTLALPGSHLYSELPSVPPPAPDVNTRINVARQRSQPPIVTQHTPPLRSSTVPLSSVASASRFVPPPRKKKRSSRRTTPASDARPTPPPIELPPLTDPPPANFLRNQQALLGHAGLVSGVHPANLSLQRHLRGKTSQNPIVVEDEGAQPSIGRHPLQTAVPTSRLPVPSTEEILQKLVKQKNLIPIMDALIRLVAGSAFPPPPASSAFYSSSTATTPGDQAGYYSSPQPYDPCPYSYQPYPSGHTYPPAASAYQQPPAPSSQPQTKKRKLNYVPAGADEWDVPYPFPEGQGPPDYYQNWQKVRGQQLVEDLIGLVKSAAKKAAVQKAHGGAQGKTTSKGKPAIGSVEYYRERVLRHYRLQGRYEGYPTLQPVHSFATVTTQLPVLRETAKEATTRVLPSIENQPVTSRTGQLSAPSADARHSEEIIAPSRSPASSATHASAVATQFTPATESQNAARLTQHEGTHAAPASMSEVMSDQILEQTTINTQGNIDEWLSILNDLLASDIHAHSNSTNSCSINLEDFDFAAAFDMTGLAASADGPAGGLSTGAIADASAADPDALDLDLTSSLQPDFAIDPELLALPHSDPPPHTVIGAEEQRRPAEPSMQTTNMALGSGAPPTPTLVGSPMSQAEYDPPTPNWNFQFPEPDIAGSERGGSEMRGDQDGMGEVGKSSEDKGKRREVIDVDGEDSPMTVDPATSGSSRESESPEHQQVRQFDIPIMPPPPPQPQWAPPFAMLDALEPLRKTLEAYLPPQQRSRVPSFLAAPSVVVPPKAPSTSVNQVKDREDIIRRARLMRSQLAEEIKRAKVELWETAMEGGCLAVLAKEKEKLVAEGTP